MKKVWNQIMYFLKNKKCYEKEFNGFTVCFHQYDMRIKSISGDFYLKIRSDAHPFAYLAASITQAREDNLHGYAVFMYMVAMNITKDDKLRKELQKAIERYLGRIEAISVVNEDKEKEESDLNVVKAHQEASKMSRAERRARIREAKKIIKREGNHE